MGRQVHARRVVFVPLGQIACRLGQDMQVVVRPARDAAHFQRHILRLRAPTLFREPPQGDPFVARIRIDPWINEVGGGEQELATALRRAQGQGNVPADKLRSDLQIVPPEQRCARLKRPRVGQLLVALSIEFGAKLAVVAVLGLHWVLPD